MDHGGYVGSPSTRYAGAHLFAQGPNSPVDTRYTENYAPTSPYPGGTPRGAGGLSMDIDRRMDASPAHFKYTPRQAGHPSNGGAGTGGSGVGGHNKSTQGGSGGVGSSGGGGGGQKAPSSDAPPGVSLFNAWDTRSVMDGQQASSSDMPPSGGVGRPMWPADGYGHRTEGLEFGGQQYGSGEYYGDEGQFGGNGSDNTQYQAVNTPGINNNSNTSNTEGRWVTVFGFPPGHQGLVLDTFHSYGQILRVKHAQNQGNWIHVLYQTRLQAQKALGKNGKIIHGNIMIGVVRTADSDVTKEHVPSVELEGGATHGMGTEGSAMRHGDDLLDPHKRYQPFSSDYRVDPNDPTKPVPQRSWWNKLSEYVIGI